MSSIGPVVSEEKMFEMLPDDGRTDARVTGILLAHQWAFGSGELKISSKTFKHKRLPDALLLDDFDWSKL